MFSLFSETRSGIHFAQKCASLSGKGTGSLALFGPTRYARILGALAMPNLLAQAIAPSLFAIALYGYGAETTLAITATVAAARVVMGVALWIRARRNTE